MPTPLPACLETRDLWFGYDPQAPVLKGISLAIPKGDFVAVIGQNGSGKTTLAKHFNGLLRPNSGQVLVSGQDVRGLSIGELSSRVGYVFQNPDHQIFSATVWDEIAFGPRNLGLAEDEVRRRAQETLETFRLGGYAGQQPAALSYGLRRKVTIAAVYAMAPEILILDEPTTGLDWKNITELMSLLVEFNRRGNTILLITHDMRLVADSIPHCMVIDGGQLLSYGETRSFFKATDTLQKMHLSLPQVGQLAQRLEPFGVRADILSVDEFCEVYWKLIAGDLAP
jgi:energy-coupling factor transport system ATP-binding protein